MSDCPHHLKHCQTQTSTFTTATANANATANTIATANTTAYTPAPAKLRAGLTKALKVYTDSCVQVPIQKQEFSPESF